MKTRLRLIGVFLLLTGLVMPFTNCATYDEAEGDKPVVNMCFSNCPEDADSKLDFEFNGVSNPLIYEETDYVELGGFCNAGTNSGAAILWTLVDPTTNGSYGKVFGNIFKSTTTGLYVADCINGAFHITVPANVVPLPGKEVQARIFYKQGSGYGEAPYPKTLFVNFGDGVR